MKELSIEEKVRRYNEAIEIAKSKIKNDKDHVLYEDDIIEIFPELKEVEDEKIRETLIYIVKSACDTYGIKYRGKEIGEEKLLAWLEKQGEHARFRRAIQVGDQVTKNDDGVLVNLSQLKRVAKPRQNPADKIEPKFHKDDWIIHHGTKNIYQVVAIIDNQYQLKYGDNYTTQYCEDVDRCARLWDITKDAKDGDVLVDEYNNIGIYKEIEGICWHSYMYLGCNNSLYGFSIGGSHVQNNTKPATKEQRDLLFQKTKEAGYEWDINKKELKKMEQNLI